MADDNALQDSLSDAPQQGGLDSPEMQPGSGQAPQIPLQSPSSVDQDPYAAIQPHVDFTQQIAQMHRDADGHDRGQRRRDVLANALSGFIFSLGQGLSASASAPRGQEGTAGAGAALQGPQILQQMRQQQQQRQAQIQDTLSQARLRNLQANPVPLTDINGKPVLDVNGFPETLPGMYAGPVMRALIGQQSADRRAAGKNAVGIVNAQLKGMSHGTRVDLDENGNYSVRQASPDEMTDMEKANLAKTKAQTDLTKMQAAHQRFQTVGPALMDLSDPNNPKKVLDTRPDVNVTPEMAQSLGIPEGLANKTYPVADFNGLLEKLAKPYKVADTGDGVYSYNVLTREKNKIGAPKPTGGPGAGMQIVQREGANGPEFYRVSKAGAEGPVTDAHSQIVVPKAGQTAETQARAADSTRQMVDIVRSIVDKNPNIVGPAIGRANEIMLKFGGDPGGILQALAGAQNMPEGYEKTTALLAGHLAYLFLNEARATLPGRPAAQLFEYVKQRSAQLSQNPQLMSGFLDAAVNNANIITKGIRPPAAPDGSRTQNFSGMLNGKPHTFAIPADQVGAFKKAHPEARPQ